jgi:hypothetical protein
MHTHVAGFQNQFVATVTGQPYQESQFQLR